MNRWPHGDPDAVVRDVLAASAYRRAPITTAKPPAPSFWQTLWSWFVEHVLAPIFGPIGRAIASASTSGFGTFAIVVLALAVLALVAFAIYRIVARLERTSRARGAARAAATSLRSPRDAAAWRALAADAAARGDHARAIAALFAAALALLDERAVVRFDAARTPGEYRRAVRRERATSADDFDDLAKRFVLVAYANERPGPGAFVEAERAFERFERSSPQRSA